MRDPRLTGFAKAMRKAATEPEQRLWLALRARRFAGTKFRRQKVIGPYVVDFACRDPMLIIEVDGDTHGQQEQYDTQRTDYLEQQGYCVIRFSNQDVMTNLEGVLLSLEARLTPPLPALSPSGERVEDIL